MFSIAIYDTRKRRLVLARDRFGIKPLFFSFKKNHLFFSSELNSFKHFPIIDLEPNEQSIFDFVGLSYIPAPNTFYKNIANLEPGYFIDAYKMNDQITYKKEKFNKWDIQINERLSYGECIEKTELLINDSVKRQLESDVPLGSLLSGGIDSSLVSEVASTHINDNSLNTYNVKFSDEEYDETWAALIVANSINSKHDTLINNQNSANLDFIFDMLLHAGQPFADTSIFPLSAISKVISEHMTVVLSGDGGDEGFAGYRLYGHLLRLASLKRIPQIFWDSINVLSKTLYRHQLITSSFSNNFSEFANADNTKMIQNMFCYIRESEHNSLFNNKYYKPVRRYFEKKWKYSHNISEHQIQDLISHATEVNLRLKLPNDYLFKVDTASMKNSIEVRVPMLDEDLINFSLSIPYNHKLKNNQPKSILRTLAKKKLPLKIANKPKMGFGIPIDTWISKDGRKTIYDLLMHESKVIPEILNKKKYSKWLEAFRDRTALRGVSREGVYNRVIILLALHLYID